MFKDFLKKFIPSFLLSWYHFFLALLGAVFYGSPSHKLKIIGVTGTNGKSTVVELTAKILEQAGFKVASLSSIKFKIGDKEWENTLKQTMPGRFQLQRFLKQALNASCQYVILEVTSEGILQYRHKFIDFDIAVFTNLTPEHIEAHGSFEKYKTAKGKLFQTTKKMHIVNTDDENIEYFFQFPAERKWTYGIDTEHPPKARLATGGQTPNTKYVRAQSIQVDLSGVGFSVQGIKFSLKLLGQFNIYNSLAAICVGLSQDISLKTCKLALEKVEGIPGRMEEVISEPFKVFVDYAFTPNALEKAYQTLKTNRLICVLGAAGGGRDKWKRPVLGKLASQYCDEIVITNEDPYDEDPITIIDQVAKGCSKEVKKILDRRKAIQKALKLAKPADLVIITGKGSEPWICIGKGKKIPWDDRTIIREEFRKLQIK